MSTVPSIAGYELQQDSSGTLILTRRGVTLGFVTDVAGIHVVLRGSRVDTSFEISQHVNRASAITALMHACCAEATNNEHSTETARITPIGRPESTASATGNGRALAV